MSVINKMLKDLDQRQAESAGENESPINRNYVPVAKSKVNWLLVVMSLIFVALVVIGWKLSFTGNDNTKAESGKLPTQASPVALSRQDNTVIKAVDNDQQTTSVAAKIDDVKEPTADVIASVNEWNANGVDSNGSAQSLVNSKQAVLESTQEQEPLDSMKANVEKRSADVAKVVQNNSIEHSNESSSNLLSTSVTGSSAENKNTETEPSTAKESTFVIERTNVSLTPEQRVEKLLAAAKKSFDKGYISEGITQLEQLLKMSDGHVEARGLLAGAWYGRGESNRAIAILNNGLQRYPNVEMWRLTAAKIFFKENNAAGALSYLDVQINDASLEFLTMKGSLGRQLQQFDKAEQAYLQLIKLQPNTGNWWLGLAIAQDSQGKSEQALESYTTLLQLGGVSKDSMTFAKQRSTELKG